MVLIELALESIPLLIQRGVEGVRTIRETAHSLVSNLDWELGADIAVVWRIVSNVGLHQLVAVDELAGTRCVIL